MTSGSPGHSQPSYTSEYTPRDTSQISIGWLEKKALEEWGVKERKQWQLENVAHLLQKTEVVLTVATGAGKSMLMLLTLRAAKETRKREIAIAVMPTIVLANDQAREATAFGISAIAINQESLNSARKLQRNLWREVEEGQWDLAIFSPEMLQSPGFSRLIGSKTFLKMLSWVFLDEIHLVFEWGKTWRPAYLAVGNLRNRLPSNITFCGYTATLASRNRDAVKRALGFRPQLHYDVQLPTDRPNIKYVPRFLTHSIGPHVRAFPDLAWLIPMSAKAISDIPQALVYCDTVDLGERLIAYLDSLIPSEMAGGGRAVLPYFSYQRKATQDQYRDDFNDGCCRILIATNCASVGVNLRTALLVCLTLPPTIEMLSQWTGRAGRGIGDSVAIIYAPDGLRLETEIELNGEGTLKKGKMSKKTLDDRKKKRAQYEDVMIAFLNPTPEQCCRHVLLTHFGDPVPPPNPHCCIVHEPDDAHAEEVCRRADSVEKAKRSRLILPGSEESVKLPMLNAGGKKKARAQLNFWRLQVQTQNSQYAYLPSSSILPTSIIDRIIERLHVIHNRAGFNMVVHNWAHHASHGDNLYNMVQRIQQLTWQLDNDSGPGPSLPQTTLLASESVAVPLERTTDDDSNPDEHTLEDQHSQSRRSSRRIQEAAAGQAKRQAEEEAKALGDSPKKRRGAKENATPLPTQPPNAARYVKRTRYGRVPVAKDRTS